MALVVVLGAPSVVALGWAGLGIFWAAGVVQMMRTRQFLLARDVVVGLLGGALGIVVGTVTALLQHPSWGVVIGPVVGVAAAAVLVSVALPEKATVRKGRILDLCEGLALFALVPLLVLALGLITAFRLIGGQQARFVEAHATTAAGWSRPSSAGPPAAERSRVSPGPGRWSPGDARGTAGRRRGDRRLFAQPLPDGWDNGYVVIGKTSAAGSSRSRACCTRCSTRPRLG